MVEYMPRVVDGILEFRLRSKGAVWIRGPKWCGKSTTAERFSKTTIRMQDEETRRQNMALARLSPPDFLKGDVPLLIDEWQVIPFIWNQVRLEVDRRGEFGQFILTGSAQPRLSEEEEGGIHSGTGRIAPMTMRPMSLFESRESDGGVSLKGLFEGRALEPRRCDKKLGDYAYFTARGGWPRSVTCDRDVALQQAIDYVDGLVGSEMSLEGDVRRDPERVRLLLRSYSRNCSTQANNSTIKADMVANDLGSLDEDTIASYVKALKRLYVVEEAEAWNPNIRSKTAIRTSNTRYLVDPSLACASLGIGPEGLIGDLELFGLLFENLCVRDLRVYSEPLKGSVKHYRDSSGLEVDAVVVLDSGDWAAIEVKLGSDEMIEEGARSLKRLADRMDPRSRKPRFLMVLTASGAAYRREDGVLVVPLGCLGP